MGAAYHIHSVIALCVTALLWLVPLWIIIRIIGHVYDWIEWRQDR